MSIALPELNPTIDPLSLAKVLWPNIYLYREQQEIIKSVWHNDETVVPAGNMLGKDYVAARLIILFFLIHRPCRIVTTSAKDDHLRVLWGEMQQAVNESEAILRAPDGPFILTHHQIKRTYKGQVCPISYVKGMVANPDSIASMQGHHARHTLFVADEASSVPDEYFSMCSTWASGGPGRKRMLIFGNPWPCSNYFFRAVEGDPATGDPGGDLLAEE